MIKGSPRAATIARAMFLLVLEAIGALALLLFIVWWTMFSGRKRGERHGRTDGDSQGGDDGRGAGGG